MLCIRRNYLTSVPRSGLDGILFQDAPEIKGFGNLFSIGADTAAFFLAFIVAIVMVFALLKNHPEYGNMGNGGEKGIGSLVNEKTLIHKLTKITEKLDVVEKRLNKKNENPLDNVDKSTRKNTWLAIYCLLMTWIPVNTIILIFDQIFKTAHKILERGASFSGHPKNIFVRSFCETLKQLSNVKCMLWNAPLI